MRDFSWKYFAMTGDVDAYLFFKETEVMNVQDAAEGESVEHEEAIE